jgi:hypothetical protein
VANKVGKSSSVGVRKLTGELPHSQLTAGELENARPPMDEHKKPATERVTGNKTKPRLASAKVPLPERMGVGQRIYLWCKVAYCGLAQRSAQGTLVLSPQPCRYRDPRIRCRTNIHPYTWSWHA